MNYSRINSVLSTLFLMSALAVMGCRKNPRSFDPVEASLARLSVLYADVVLELQSTRNMQDVTIQNIISNSVAKGGEWSVNRFGERDIQLMINPDTQAWRVSLTNQNCAASDEIAIYFILPNNTIPTGKCVGLKFNGQQGVYSIPKWRPYKFIRGRKGGEGSALHNKQTE